MEIKEADEARAAAVDAAGAIAPVAVPVAIASARNAVQESSTRPEFPVISGSVPSAVR